jgi:hypothetical protein
VSLETDRDPILPCRVLNILRRKGELVRRMLLEDRGDAFHISCLVDVGTNSSHLRAFLQSVPGIRVREFRRWASR